MKILVIGSGGREHAIARKLLAEKQVTAVYCAKGNPGMTKDGICLVNIPEDDHEALIDFVKKENIAWTFVGPEIPLLNGIVDDFQRAGCKIFGPTKAAAEIEGSKDFAKKLMQDNGIPTAAYQTFIELAPAVEYVKEQGVPIVIKADGLAAGKGVVVAETLPQAIHALEDMLARHKFGKSGAKVVIEEFLDGEEFSLMAFVKGSEVYPMVIAQDHKRAYDGDHGPNTGGMGAYSPVPQISDALVAEAVEKVLKPAAIGMIEKNIPFQGILYAGLIATEKGPKVIEFNARFGDPETQVVLPRLSSSLFQIIDNLLNDKVPTIMWSPQTSLGVVVAAEGYPEKYQQGMPIPSILSSKVRVSYAGVAESENGTLQANGGRVFLVEATGSTLDEAKRKVYQTLDELPLSKMFYRHDIGEKAGS
ncbi:phosphoribosylamine--glycine ligase [Enterococcus sp. JM9B]|uniref:phosphoribosylamine--glycine ligase n=1 Tax=Enterococcus sp. JM9B TaxID=1857216 RepID=UPI0013751CA9|nr:phosphoribosylamine--glycine ligase [Enterococcus sp. JM9B]KAF1304732.1 phosphoribosylamine--glycine ligase [Enterococcus sp. JM9B]